jgi:Ca2+-binding RTX toxin-like protein
MGAFLYLLAAVGFGAALLGIFDDDDAEATVTDEGSDDLTDSVDALAGTDGDDSIYGQADDDRISGLDGDDELDSGAGDDTLAGDDGDDTLYGGLDDDSLDGGSGADFLHGELGWDTLDGGAGTDTLIGGPGNDLILDYDRSDADGPNASLVEAGNGDDRNLVDGGSTITGGGVKIGSMSTQI